VLLDMAMLVWEEQAFTEHPDRCATCKQAVLLPLRLQCVGTDIDPPAVMCDVVIAFGVGLLLVANNRGVGFDCVILIKGGTAVAPPAAGQLDVFVERVFGLGNSKTSAS
jgi:hypothetical protein